MKMYLVQASYMSDKKSSFRECGLVLTLYLQNANSFFKCVFIDMVSGKQEFKVVLIIFQYWNNNVDVISGCLASYRL